MSDETAVSYFVHDHPTLARTVKAKLLHRLHELQVNVGEGCATDWSDYRHRMGQIKAFKEAVQICEGVEAGLNS